MTMYVTKEAENLKASNDMMIIKIGLFAHSQAETDNNDLKIFPFFHLLVFEVLEATMI